MSDNKNQGGAGSALGAHSKDTGHGSSQPHGSTGASGQSTSTQDRGSGSWQQAGADMAGQAKEGVERMAHNVRDAAASARDTIATSGSKAMETTNQMVRDQPMMALAVTGIACLAIGMMIGRGRY
jgi:ElaB/YqjD/DUF883 family membrane-anchored ribosome-binding protein